MGAGGTDGRHRGRSTRRCGPAPGDLRELPEAYEEPAWIGLRWRIRQRTFLHVYTTDGRRSAYIDMDDPAVLMTFRAPPGELAALAHAGPPFFRADWGVNVVGMVLGGDTDWVEVAELVTDSYRVQAPRRLALRLDADG